MIRSKNTHVEAATAQTVEGLHVNGVESTDFLAGTVTIQLRPASAPGGLLTETRPCIVLKGAGAKRCIFQYVQANNNNGYNQDCVMVTDEAGNPLPIITG
jgi:hypothetical protein